MSYIEKPPILRGTELEQLCQLRDYLFRMVSGLNESLTADVSTTANVRLTTRADGQQVARVGGGSGDAADIEAVRRNAQELKALIIKSAKGLQDQIDSIEHSTFYIKYADDFAGTYPETMYNTPTADTYYMGVCSSTEETAPTDPADYSWSRIKGDGGTGLNSATVFLYRRANSAPNKPRVALTYTFASGRLDLGPASVSGHKLVDADISVSGHKATLNSAEVEDHIASVTGWTQEIPDSDGRPCWVITATAIATTATDTIAASEWSDVKKLVEDGQRGIDGQPGQNGQQGEPGEPGLNGYNTAIVYLYKRAASAPSVDWQTTLWYSFPDKEITTELPSGWYDEPPAHDGNPLYVTAATAASRNDTDDIGYGEWSTPVMMAEDGQNGTPGAPGQNGKTTYLHIKYSDDGTQFTENPTTHVRDGETVGAYIGTLTDYTEQDSMTFSDYTWHRFADDEEIQASMATMRSDLESSDLAVQAYCDSKVDEYSSLFVAQSEYGTFTESINSRIEATAKSVVESYDYAATIASMQDSVDLVQDYFTRVNGEIRRGYIADPDDNDNIVLGIAIGQNLQFNAGIRTEGSYTYYQLQEHQTFGLYTSMGWQFWIDGHKAGWFNSTDGMLHVGSIIVEQSLQIGGSWQIRSKADGSEFEILYVGA